MNYHLNRQGTSLGVFTLEELRVRRQTGELDGTELVWMEGMAQWQPLDLILNNPALPPKTPPKASAPSVATGIIVFIVLAGIGLAVLVGYNLVNRLKKQKSVLAQAFTSRNEGDSGVDIASRPIVIPSGSRTEAIVRKRARAFRERQWLEGYRLRGNHAQPCDAQAVEFLNAWLKGEHSDVPGTNLAFARQLGDKIADNRACNEPLILSIAGAESIEVFEAIRRFEAALSSFPGSRHLAYPQMYANIILAEHLSDQGRISALDADAVKLFEQGFKDGSFVPEDQPDLAEIFLNNWGKDFFYRNADTVTQGVKDAGPRYEWLATILQGQRQIDEAWAARGSGTSDTVSDKGWEAFNQHMLLAQKHLTTAWKLNPSEPLAATKMITVSMGQNSLEDMRLWFDRAIAAQMDEPNAWSSFRWGLRPRWFGSLNAIRDLGIQAVNTGRFDTDVPRKFFDSVSDIEDELKKQPGEHIYGRSDIWPYLEKMYRGYIAEPSQAPSQAGWRNAFAVISFLGGHYPIAREQLEALQWKPSLETLSGYGTDLTLMAQETAARTSILSNEIARAENLYWRGEVTNALAQYKNLSQQRIGDEHAMDFIRHRLTSLELEQTMAAGDWVDFLPKGDDDPNWQLLTGKAKTLPDGSLQVDAGRAGHLHYCRARLRGGFEVKGDIEVIRSSNSSFQGGLVMGQPEVGTYQFNGFRLKRNSTEGDIVSFAKGWGRSQVYQRTKLDGTKNSFVFHLRNGRVTASVNGNSVLTAAKVPATLSLRPYEFYVGLGAYNDSNETTLRYSNVKIRRLMSTTAPTDKGTPRKKTPNLGGVREE
jgi:hypothetical protein